MTARTVALAIVVIAIVGVLIATPAISAHGIDGPTTNETTEQVTATMPGHGHHVAGNASGWLPTHAGEWMTAHPNVTGIDGSDWSGVHATASEWLAVHATASDWMHVGNDTIAGPAHVDADGHGPHDDFVRGSHHDDRRHRTGGHGC